MLNWQLFRHDLKQIHASHSLLPAPHKLIEEQKAVISMTHNINERYSNQEPVITRTSCFDVSRQLDNTSSGTDPTSKISMRMELSGIVQRPSDWRRTSAPICHKPEYFNDEKLLGFLSIPKLDTRIDIRTTDHWGGFFSTSNPVSPYPSLGGTPPSSISIRSIQASKVFQSYTNAIEVTPRSTSLARVSRTRSCNSYYQSSTWVM